MPKLILLRGLPASGKTTWALQWLAADSETRARVNRDDLRAALFGKATYSYAQEELITAAERDVARQALTAGRDIVVDATNLRPKYCRSWRRFALARGADFEIKDFSISLKDAISRDASRVHPVGETAIRRMHDKYTRHGELQPIPDEGEPELTPSQYEPISGTPRAVVVDIDGTIALNLGGRSPYEWMRVGEDDINPRVVDLVRDLHALDYAVIIMSGRDNSCRDITIEWLDRHRIAYDHLFMRPEGDHRRDSIVKLEMFDRDVRNAYDVRWVLDDRQQVVEAWRSIGLTCLQVAPGDF
jgi:predicted kinase